MLVKKKNLGLPRGFLHILENTTTEQQLLHENYAKTRIKGHVDIHSLGRGGLMVTALVSGSSGPGSSPGRGYCVVLLGKKIYSDSFTQ